MKSVGIIGGLGPQTTATFYLELSSECYQKNKERRPAILMWNVPQSYKVEKEAQVDATGEEKYIPYLVNAAKMLENARVDFIVMPCNTLHIFIGEIRKSVKIPVLSIVEETLKFLKKKNIKKIGLLATPSIVKNRLYADPLKKEGIDLILPSNVDQARVGKIINKIVLDRSNSEDRDELLKIIEGFSQKGVKHILLACTDLQLLIPVHPKLKIYDTMKIFSGSTVREILKK